MKTITNQQKTALENALKTYSETWNGSDLGVKINEILDANKYNIYLNCEDKENSTIKVYGTIKNFLGTGEETVLELDYNFTFMGYFDMIEKLDNLEAKIKALQDKNDELLETRENTNLLPF